MKKILILLNSRLLIFAIPATILAVGLQFSCSKSTVATANNTTATPPITQPPANVNINVMSVGAKGDGTTDDTRAFQKAIDSAATLGGGTVYVPAATYLINPDVSIMMKTNVTLNMVDTTRILQATASANTRYYMIKMSGVNDAKVIGGKIVGDRTIHIGTTGEWGMGIAILGCRRAIVTGTHVVNCWGDGLEVASFNGGNSTACVLKNITSDNNRRQALTIVGGVDSLTVDSCILTHTNGTAPQDGIDIEPDAGIAQRVHITNCVIAYNTGNGVEMNAKTTTTAVITNIFVQNNYIHHNPYSGYVQYVSNIVFTNNRMINNKYQGNAVHTNAATNSLFNPNTYQ